MKPCHHFPLRHFCPVLLLSFAALSSVQAQTGGTGAPPAKEKSPATAPATASVTVSETDRMNQNLSDLELLRPLLPLNLTQKQLDSLVAAMKEIATEWRDIKKQDDAALLALGPDIDKAHAAALTGIPITKEFDAKVLEAQKAAAIRYNSARLKATKRLLLLLDSSLTAPQKESVEAWSTQQLGGRRIPKKYQANPAKTPREESQALGILTMIERNLLLDRTLALLQQFKPASSDAPAVPPAPDVPPVPAAK